MKATAGALGLKPDDVHGFIRKARLRDFVRGLRVTRSRERHTRLIELLIEHAGNISAVARALGRRQSTVYDRIEKEKLLSFARSLKPRPPPEAEEKRSIQDALRRHRGQTKGVCKELGISKGTLRARMRKHGLFAEADALRLDANLTGPRKHISRDWNREERRARLVTLLESCNWNVDRARRIEGVAGATFYARMRDLGIRRPSRITPRDRLHQLIDALRATNGVVSSAARSMGVSDTTFYKWCRELELEPREYRPR